VIARVVPGAAVHLILLGGLAVLGSGPALSIGIVGFILAMTFASACEAAVQVRAGATAITSRSGWVTGTALLATVVAGLLWPRPDPPVGGTVLVLVGAGLRCSAISTLGPLFRNEVAVVSGHALVTGGPYRWIRHPSELGTLVWGAAAAVTLGGVSPYVGASLLLPAVLARVVLEERMLEAAFGDSFRRYRRTTGALLPRVLGGAARAEPPLPL
jgi:protein-S-isoprenylcysteine O-methyltransferase Ste14